MGDPTARVAEVFGAAAATYGTGPDFFWPFGRRLVQRAGVSPGERVLDVATGTGAVAVPAVEAGARVVAIDIAAEMVERARAHGIDAHVADARELPFGDASFDRVLCGFALFFLPDPERGLGELARVLRPGGTLAFTTFPRRDPRWAWLGELLPRTAGVPTSERFRDRATIAALLTETGHGPPVFAEEELELEFASAEEWWRWLWSHGHRGVLESLGDEERDRFREAAFGRIASMGRIVNTIACLFTTAVRP